MFHTSAASHWALISVPYELMMKCDYLACSAENALLTV